MCLTLRAHINTQEFSDHQSKASIPHDEDKGGMVPIQDHSGFLHAIPPERDPPYEAISCHAETRMR
jgi:hypothetical protein